MATPDTITSLKESFLRTQIRLLSQPLHPSRNWQDRAPVPAQGALKEKIIQEVLYKLNTIARNHKRAVYSSQALRHVAEQIDALYWASGAPDWDVEEEGGDGLVRGVDLRDAVTIATLPDAWPEAVEADESGLETFGEQKRYQQLRARLVDLAARRQAQKQRLAQYRQLLQLLEPFREPQVNVQPNLVTKDGELKTELDRMRVLIARVASGLQGGEEGEATGGNGEVEERRERSAEEKLAALLALE